MKSKNYLFKFLEFVKSEKYKFMLAIALILIATYFNIKSIGILSKVFDEKIVELDKYDALIFARKLSFVYIMYKFLEFVIEIIKRNLIVDAGNNIQKNIQKMIFSHIMQLPIEYFDNIPAGSVLTRITSDVSKIKILSKSIFSDVIVAIIKIVVMYTIMLVIDYKLSLILLFSIPIFYGLNRINVKCTYSLRTELRAKDTEISAKSNEIMQNLEIVKAFGVENQIYDKWNDIAKKRKKIDLKLLFYESVFSYNVISLVFLLLQFTIIIYYSISKYKGFNWISSADIIIFIFYISSIISELQNLFAYIPTYISARASAKNIYDVLELNEIEKNDGSVFENLKYDIEFKDVSFAYKDEYILKDINFEIKENEYVAFVGHTGSGKSTIMNLLVKFYKNQKGEILIGNTNINYINSKCIRDNIAIVLQDAFLFQDTIANNVCSDRKKAKKCLEMVGASYIIKQRGLDYEILANGTNFSSGEKQLISFARALAKNPKILILDEATASIDSKTEQIIQEGINVLKESRTTIVIAHRLSTIKNADRIYVLDKGRIVECGNHNDLISKNGIYTQMVEKNERQP